MQDYSKLFRSRILVKQQNSKLRQIRKLLLSGLPTEILLLLIVAIILPKDILFMLKR